MFFETGDLPNMKMITDLFSNGEKTTDIVGFFSPWLLMVIGIINLWNRKPFMYAYLIGGVVNKYLNLFLKNAIKQPRPTNGRSLVDEPYGGSDTYGMPSFHSQSSFYSIAYLFFVKQSVFLFGIELLIGMASIYQRWKYRRHTVEQLGAGAFVGITLAYVTFYVTNRLLITNKSIQ